MRGEPGHSGVSSGLFREMMCYCYEGRPGKGSRWSDFCQRSDIEGGAAGTGQPSQRRRGTIEAILRGLHVRNGSPSPELLLTGPLCEQDGGRVLSSPGWTQPLLRDGWSHCLHAPPSISPQTCQKMRGINKPHPHCPPQGGAWGGAARELSPYMELVWVGQFP